MPHPSAAVVHHPRSVNGSALRRGERQSSARRVYDVLRTAIRDGQLPRGTSLVEEHLVQAMSASRQAVREALQALATEGLVARRRRVGTTVSATIMSVAADQLMTLDDESELPASSELELLEERELPCPPWLRERLQVDADEQVRMIEQVIRVDGEAVCTRVAYLPMSRLPSSHVDRVHDLASAFALSYGVAMAPIASLVEAVSADPMTAELLDVLPGSPLLVRESLISGVDGLPREICYMHYRGDRFCFVSHSG